MDEIKEATLSALRLGIQSSEKQVSGDLGQEDFLKLMTAQLQAQDPFNPMESGKFFGQLAQFGTVSGIQDLNQSFSELAVSLQSMQALQASSLVGRSVIVNGDVAVLPSEGMLEGRVQLPSGVSQATLAIYDMSGQLVKKLQLGGDPSGSIEFAWDGLAEDGTPSPPGKYRIEALTTVDGQAVALSTQVKAAVESVTLGQGGGFFALNLSELGSVDIGAVVEIA